MRSFSVLEAVSFLSDVESSGPVQDWNSRPH